MPEVPDFIGVVSRELSKLFSKSTEDRPDSILSEYPKVNAVHSGLEKLLDAVFPGRHSEHNVLEQGLEGYIEQTLDQAAKILLLEFKTALPLRWIGEASNEKQKPKNFDVSAEAHKLLEVFFQKLPSIRAALIQDIQAAYDGDPAAHSFAEVKMAYPGLLAIASHRIAHELYLLDIPTIPRVMSELTHTQTGCDIHPGATIGKGFFVDHPTGVVIGETAIIGNNVKLYQGVTIGAKSFPLDDKGRPIKHIRRHPEVKDNVVIYSNATILGGKTVIGAGATIGGNVFLMKSVPANCIVTNQSPEPRVNKTTASE